LPKSRPILDFIEVPREAANWSRQHEKEEHARDKRGREGLKTDAVEEVDEQGSGKGLDGNSGTKGQARDPLAVALVCEEGRVEQCRDQDVRLAKDQVINREDRDEQGREPVETRRNWRAILEAQEPREAEGEKEQTEVDGIPREEEAGESEGTQWRDQDRECRWIAVMVKAGEAVAV